LDEIVVITWAHDPLVQQASYALLAEEMGLGQPAGGLKRVLSSKTSEPIFSL
jgi:hypothetical protein